MPARERDDGRARLAVVVLSLGADPLLVEAVRSVSAGQGPGEVVVVNSGGGDPVALLEAAGLDAAVVNRNEVLWPGAVRNLGIAATSARYVTFLAADCLATPGWVAARLARHDAGAPAVASALLPDAPRNPVALAGHLALFARRLPRTPPAEALCYSASYDRRLFDRYGLFRETLRIGEDSDFHARLVAADKPVFAPEVQTVHRSPRGIGALVGDQFARGRRSAALARQTGRRNPADVARSALGRTRTTLRLARTALVGEERRTLRLAAPLVALASESYAAGALFPRTGDMEDSALLRGHGRRLTVRIKLAARIARRLDPDRPLFVAVFSFRFDADLVPALLKNIAPLVDGYVAYDDRHSTGVFSDERIRRRVLIEKARRLGADWVLAVDPDERFEQRLARRIRRLIATDEPVIWGFHLREMYGPRTYRIDGLWGEKSQYRLFPLRKGQTFGDNPVHQPWFPSGPGHRLEHSGFNLYHLKMITPERRRMRTALYNHLDPERRCQPIGYDYLADDAGTVFEDIPPGREYRPRHVERGGLWMARLEETARTKAAEDAA